jgi:hypothetical protein
MITDGADEMELPDFASAIPDGMFDCITFEMCFMAGIEVAWELRNKCKYILASSAEILKPGFTGTYKTSLEYLLLPAPATFSASSGQAAFGQAVLDGLQTYKPTDWQRSATYSLISADALAPLADFIRNRCDFTRTVEVTEVQRFDRNSYRLFFDMYDYFSRLLDEDDRAELARLISAAVPWKGATDNFLSGQGGFPIHEHSGLTTYIRQPAFPFLNARYDNLGWAIAIK